MIKAVQLITFLNDAGAENIVKNYCLTLDKTEFQPVVVTLFDYCKGCSVYRAIKENGTPIISVYDENYHESWFATWVKGLGKGSPKSLFSRVWNRFFADKTVDFLENIFNRRTARKLSRIFKKLEPDVIHAHLHVQNVLQYTDTANAKLFYTCHSEPYRYFSGKEYNSTRALLAGGGIRLCALHEMMKEEIDRMFYINNTVVLNNWIDIDRFRQVKESKQKIRESLEIDKNVFAIGTIGRITEYKNQIFLVGVLKAISEKKSDAICIIVGEGSQSVKDSIICEAKNAGVADRLLFLGIRKDTERIYKAMDVFMLPSKFEGFPVVAVEAQAAGLKTIISDKVPNAVLLSPDSFSLPITDAQKWADVALNSKLKNSQYGNIAEFDLKSGIKKLQALYTERGI